MPISRLKQKVHAIAPQAFEGTPVLFAYLYGSHAAELQHPYSDLDIGIFVEGLSTRDCLKLELSLSLKLDELLDHAVQSDVRVVNHLPLSITGRILTEGELIYSRAEDERIDFETQVRRAYFDFLPVIRQFQKAFLDEAVGGARP